MNKSPKKLLRSSKLSTKSPFPLLRLPVAFGSSKNAIILALVIFALLCGCQEREKVIYKVPPSAYVAELEQQERAYRDSLEKYCALLDTAQIQHYLDLHKSASAAYSAALRQEVDAFMAERDKYEIKKKE